jgi:hypothetical protein
VANLRTFTPLLAVGWFIGLTCGSIVLTWLYDGSGGSILLVAVWHGLYNLVAGTAAAHGILGVLVTVLVMIQASACIVHYLRQPSPRPVGDWLEVRAGSLPARTPPARGPVARDRVPRGTT